MNSKEYWRKREDEALKHYIKDEKEYDKQIKRIYQDMLDSCQTQINDFYGRYASKEGITLAEAKKRVSKLDIEKYERKAAKYVKDKDFSDKANEEMRLYNATMKINRLEMLKANIGLELISGHDELEKFMAGILKGRTEEELKRQAGILGKTIRNNAKTANAIVNGSFRVSKVGEKSTFSDYIWQYQDLMREDLGKILATGLIQGKNPRAIAKDLRKYWYGSDPKTGGGATYCMERLMRTELARVQTEAQKQSFERNGFEKYIFIVNAGCCGHCEEVADKDSGYGKGVYLVKDMQPGLNAPPIHPNDRCSTAAYEDSKEYEEWLNFLANGGTTAEFEQMKVVKNDTNRQAQIRARREEYKRRKQKEFNPKTIDEVNSFATETLARAYENHRLSNGLRSTPYSELKDSPFNNTKANFGKMSVDSASAFSKTLAKLVDEYDTPIQTIRLMTKDEFAFMSKTFATVRHNYTVDSAELIINPAKCNDFTKLTDRLKELTKKGYIVDIPDSAVGEYIITHEFAHTLLNIEQPLNNKTNWVNADYDKIRKARKEIDVVYREYKAEVRDITTRLKADELEVLTTFDEEAFKRAKKSADELKTVKLSDYSLESADEFIAESFANERLGTKPNSYSKRVVEILDRNFKR